MDSVNLELEYIQIGSDAFDQRHAIAVSLNAQSKTVVRDFVIIPAVRSHHSGMAA